MAVGEHEWSWVRTSRDVIVKDLLRDSVGIEVLQGLSSGDTPGLSNRSAYTCTNDLISDCSKRVNKSSLEECAEHSNRYMSPAIVAWTGCSSPLVRC